MGANFAVMTTIASINRNFFISVRMINIETGQTQSQRHGETQDGTSDLVSVVQALVREMVGAAPEVVEPALLHLYSVRRPSTIFDIYVDNMVVGRSSRSVVEINTFGRQRVSANIGGRRAEVFINFEPGGIYYVRFGSTSQTRNTGQYNTTPARRGSDGRVTPGTRTPITETLHTPILQLVDRATGEREFNSGATDTDNNVRRGFFSR
jgi:hypothetical protein